MKPLIYLLVLMLTLNACSLREREKELEKKTQAINEKEQELLLKEKTLQLKEDELAAKEQILDSSLHGRFADSTQLNPAYLGTWHVRMDCIETTCQGSAVGDSKIEQWEIDSSDNGVIARALVSNKLVRVYAGRQYGNYLQLNAEEGGPYERKVRMIVRLQVNGEDVEGRREILRTGECRIVYSLALKRLQKPA